MNSLERYVIPRLGSMPISEIQRKDVIDVLSPICSDKPAMARKVRQRIDLIRRWAMAYEYRRDNPADEARNGMIRVTPSRATPHDGLASVIAGVHASGASWAITLAFEFLVLAVARPGEVRLAQWGEIDLETATWTKRVMHGMLELWHRVPLASRALDVLRKVLALNGGQNPRAEFRRQHWPHNRSFSDVEAASRASRTLRAEWRPVKFSRLVRRDGNRPDPRRTLPCS